MKAWDLFLKFQERELGVETVNKWLRSLKVAQFDACNLYLEAKDAFQVMWFEEHIRKKMKGSFLNNNRKEINVHISVQGSASRPRENKKSAQGRNGEHPQPKFSITFDSPDPLKTFVNYVESEPNILAYKLLCKLTNYDPISQTFVRSADELVAFNPIYLFGGEGCGKTHLLTATAHALAGQGMRVLFVKAQTFTEHVVTAIRAGEMGVFREAYRNIDVLLIDDVHLFSKKGATQEEFFHTFNTLHLSRKQILLSANCAPGELHGVEPRLVSRFEWGIVLPLEQPGEADLTKILKKKAVAFGIELHPKVAEYLLETFTNSPKSLMHALEALMLRHQLRQNEEGKETALTVPLVKMLLKDLIKGEQELAVTPEKIIHTTAEYFGIKVEDIFGKAQSRECSLPRQIAMYLCRIRLKMPFKKIGDIFFRDHSTVMSNVRSIEKNVAENDSEIVPSFQTISKMLSR